MDNFKGIDGFINFKEKDIVINENKFLCIIIVDKMIFVFFIMFIFS